MSILDFKSENEVLFDPGFSASVARVSGNIEYMYSAFTSIISAKQKKFQFSILYPKFLKAIEQNVAFYLGCMLWGVYLKSDTGKTIINNPCLNTEFDDEVYFETDFLLHFIKEGLNRDAKYYLNKTYATNPLHIKVLENYREFLTINKAFTDVKLTDDINLPKTLKTPNEKEIAEIYDCVCSAVKNDDVMILFDCADKIFVQ